ncbi:MAG: trypsin-like peptidase domain-containing protein [Ignavibacteriales bacterium]|nr:trypsin-like peptidase domain-containing protein [Ignavibacteriales bacterium]
MTKPPLFDPHKNTRSGSNSLEKERPFHKIPYATKKKREIRFLVVLSGFFLFILFILLIGVGKSRKIRNSEQSHQYPSREQQKQNPPIESRPARNLPEGELASWAKSVVYIEVGNMDRTTNTFHSTKSGTGFVAGNYSTIFTNNHVISNGDDILLTFYDGSIRFAQVKKSNPELDIATLSCEIPDGVPSLKINLSDNVKIGRSILVMGFPLGSQLGSEMTLTDGLISSIRKDNSGNLVWYQVSAAVNKGNSGGPLLDRNSGEVLGVVTAKIMEAENIGFARPITIVSKNFMNDL